MQGADQKGSLFCLGIRRFELWHPFKLQSGCLLTLSHSVTYSSMFEKNTEVTGTSSHRAKHSNVSIYYSLGCKQGKAITAEKKKSCSRGSIQCVAEKNRVLKVRNWINLSSVTITVLTKGQTSFKALLKLICTHS